MVGISENMSDDKIKISIAIGQGDDEFLQRLVTTGEAASKSHAVRLAIAKLRGDKR